MACADEEYISTAHTATADRVCTVLTECTALEFQTKAAGASNDRECPTLTVCDDDLQ
jgi:hypothetical protein